MIYQKVLGLVGLLLAIGIVSYLNEPTWLGIFPALGVIAATPAAGRGRPLRLSLLWASFVGAIASLLLYITNIGLIDTDAYVERFWQSIAWGMVTATAVAWICAGRHAKALPFFSIGAVLVSVFGTESVVVATHEGEIALLALLSFALISDTVSVGSWGPNYGVRGRIQTVAILFVVGFVLTRFTTSAIDRSLLALRVALDNTLQDIEFQSLTIQRAYFSRSANLHSVTNFTAQDPNHVAISVLCDERPGYLRGTCFTIYRNGGWQNGQVARRARSIPGEAPLVASRIELKGGNQFAVGERGDGRRLQILVKHEGIIGDVVFGSLATSTWIGVGRELEVDLNHVPKRGVSTTQYYASEIEEFPVRCELGAEYRAELLSVPESIEKVIEGVIDREFKTTSTNAERIEEIQQFFHSRFEYSKTTPRVRGVDPISYFLQTRHNANCEFFATAACLMLRKSGVPARYVTGFVALEEDNDNEERWLARNRDAHAWVEAYIDEKKEWVPIEFTPGRVLATPEFQADSTSTMATKESADVNTSEESLQSSQAIWAMLQFRMSEQIVWILLALIVVGYFLQVRYLAANRRKCHPKVRRLDWRCWRNGIRRNRWESLDAFAGRLVATDKLQNLAAEYRKLSREIYGQNGQL